MPTFLIWQKFRGGGGEYWSVWGNLSPPHWR